MSIRCIANRHEKRNTRSVIHS